MRCASGCIDYARTMPRTRSPQSLAAHVVATCIRRCFRRRPCMPRAAPCWTRSALCSCGHGAFGARRSLPRQRDQVRQGACRVFGSRNATESRRKLHLPTALWPMRWISATASIRASAPACRARARVDGNRRYPAIDRISVQFLSASPSAEILPAGSRSHLRDPMRPAAGIRRRSSTWSRPRPPAQSCWDSARPVLSHAIELRTPVRRLSGRAEA